jgi:hypothetical protein
MPPCPYPALGGRVIRRGPQRGSGNAARGPKWSSGRLQVPPGPGADHSPTGLPHSTRPATRRERGWAWGSVSLVESTSQAGARAGFVLGGPSPARSGRGREHRRVVGPAYSYPHPEGPHGRRAAAADTQREKEADGAHPGVRRGGQDGLDRGAHPPNCRLPHAGPAVRLGLHPSADEEHDHSDRDRVPRPPAATRPRAGAVRGRGPDVRWPRPDLSAQPRGEFARARAQAEIDTGLLRVRAARTVAGHASDPEDLCRLLAMLGLDDPGRREP